MKNVITLTAVIAALFIVSCENPSAPAPTPPSSPAPTVTSVTITGGDVTLAQGTTDYQFYATVAGTNNPATVTWSVTGANNAGTIINSSDGKLTIAEDETATSLTVTATSTVDSNQSDSITVTVVPVGTSTVTGVTITGGNISLSQGTSEYPFSALVEGANNPAQTVTWTVTGANNAGTIINSSDGKLTIAEDETATSLTVTATSTFDSNQSDSITVTVVPAGTSTVTRITVSAVGEAAEIARGATLQFTADVTVTNGALQTVTWSVAGKDKDRASVELTGTFISGAGLLTVGANETAVDLVVTAASTVSGFTDKEGSATVFVRKYQKVYLIGEDFGGWTPPVSGSYAGTEMPYANRGVYTWTGIMLPDKSFKFHDDTASGYDSGNWFVPTENNTAPAGTSQAVLAVASGANAWKTTQLGTYTISLDTTAGTVTFTRSELGATGEITLSVEDKGKGLELTKLAGDLVMYKRGEHNSLTFTVTTEGYEYTWYVDGVQKGTGGTITLNAAEYNIGGHSVTLVAKNTSTNVFWSAEPIQFKVETKVQ
jgi:hypothetical protein